MVTRRRGGRDGRGRGRGRGLRGGRLGGGRLLGACGRHSSRSRSDGGGHSLHLCSAARAGRVSSGMGICGRCSCRRVCGSVGGRRRDRLRRRLRLSCCRCPSLSSGRCGRCSRCSGLGGCGRICGCRSICAGCRHRVCRCVRRCCLRCSRCISGPFCVFGNRRERRRSCLTCTRPSLSTLRNAGCGLGSWGVTSVLSGGRGGVGVVSVLVLDVWVCCRDRGRCARDTVSGRHRQ